VPAPDDATVKNRLRIIVALLLVIGVITIGIAFVRALAPSTAVLEQRAADRTAWEKAQTAEQRARAQAWHEAVRESQRQAGLIALVFVVGHLIIVVTCIRCTRANARDVSARRLRAGQAFLRVSGRSAAALGVACGLMIIVPLIESTMAGGEGMYSGEKMLSAVFTLISFLSVWFLCSGLAYVALWRRSRADPTQHLR
jgi:hypothetical protein